MHSMPDACACSAVQLCNTVCRCQTLSTVTQAEQAGGICGAREYGRCWYHMTAGQTVGSIYRQHSARTCSACIMREVCNSGGLLSLSGTLYA